MKNSFRRNGIRCFMQFGVLIAILLFFFKAFGNESFDPEAYCPFGGIQTLATYLSRGSMACNMTLVQIMMGGMLVVGLIFFGKLFCSYLCSLGLLNEWFIKLRRTLKIKGGVIANGSLADRLLRLIKYILLGIIFYMTLSSSELFCKNFDPYYAFATGFKGELTVWMAAISVVLLLGGSLLIDMFWCKYICPLGALSNLFRGIGRFTSLVYIRKDTIKCNSCRLCVKRCPYHIEIDKIKGTGSSCGSYAGVKNADCILCGECVAVCDKNALAIGKFKYGGSYWMAGITAVLFGLALYLGNTMELPTIDVRWLPQGVRESELRPVEISGLRSVKCYGSSMAFKAQVSKIPGVYGVKTFVKHGKVIIYYLPEETTEDKIREQAFTPSMFWIGTPDKSVEKVKVVTFRTENMHDRMDLDYVGMQFGKLGRTFYGIESEYACPIIVRLYMGVNEQVDASLLKEVVQIKELDIPRPDGGVKKVFCNYKFVELEPGCDTLSLKSYLGKF